MRLYDHELNIRKRLAKARVDSPGLCARLLCAHAAGLDKIAYILACDQELPKAKESLLANIVERRAKGEPLAYILGFKEFYGVNFVVNSATLTPRPETEILVDQALAAFPENRRIFFADIGCGSGCIGLAILWQRKQWHGLLVDNSLPALAVAAQNLQKTDAQARLLQADLFQLPFQAESLDLVVSNPPYIAFEEKDQVMPECLAYEPHSALFSPCGGLRHLEAVIKSAHHCLKQGGFIILEHGASQAGKVLNILADFNFQNAKIETDLAGLPRCAIAQKINGV